MGIQYIETIGMYGKPRTLEWASELQCYDEDNTLAVACRDVIFNKQYGIFFYEPCDVKEAEKLINKFEEKIDEINSKGELKNE